jgi:hypothetical protein
MNDQAKGEAMHTTFLNRLTRRASRLVGVLAVVGMGPMLPLGAGVLATPHVAVAQAATGDDVIVFTSGKKVTGKIIEETPTAVTIKFLAGGIEATATYQKTELLSVTRGTGQTPAAPTTGTPATGLPKEQIKAAAADPIEGGKKKVYVVELTGWFGEDISQTPMRQAVKDAKKHSPDYLIFVIDNDWSLRRFGQLEDIKDDEGEFDQMWRAEAMAPVFNEEIKREWTTQPTVVFWVKKAMGGAAFLPLSCPNIYMSTEGKIGGIGGLNRIFGTMGDKVVREKQFSLRIGHAEGLAIQGGYEPRLIKALCRDETILSYRIEGGKPVYLDRMPESPDEFLLTDDADEQAGRADTIDLLARGEGNDCLTLNSDLAFKLGVSKGTTDTMDDLIFKLGIARNHEFVSGNSADAVAGSSKRITKGWIDGLEDAKRKLRKMWQDFNRVQVADPGGFQQRTQARGRQRAIIEDMQQLLKKYEEAINPRQVPCPDWATLNIIKERLKTEQMADKPDRK